MMINYEKFPFKNDQYELQSSELTLITGNNLTGRAQSIIDDDVSSDANLDFIPVKEFSKNNIFKTSDQIEIIDVPERITLYQDKSKIFKCEDSIESIKYQYQANHPIRDVDKYDLEHSHYGFSDSNKYCDDLFQTVKPACRPSITLTRHENPQLNVVHKCQSPIHNQNHQQTVPCFSPVTTDIGKQITQLARRIESLGNISRVCQDDIENHHPMIVTRDDHVCATDNLHLHSCHEKQNVDNYSVKAARKLDEIERLQKKQETMQSRLVDLAKKLNDSTRDLTLLPSTALAQEDYNSGGDYFHGKVKKPLIKKSIKKSCSKSRKTTSKAPQSSFLKNILNDVNEVTPNEMPLLSSSYCLHNDLSTGTAESGISESTSKYLNDELANIRHEFRTQVEEIRKLLSERYQKSIEQTKKHESIEHAHESLSDQIAKSVQKMSRDVSPSLRNITNINNNNSEECPLDKYLLKNNKIAELPSLDSDIVPSLRPGILPSVARAIKSKQRMLSDPVEAEKFLIELANRRSNLENNLCCLERTREKEFLFSILERLQGDENNVDLARIQALVDDAIASITPFIKQEVKLEYLNWIEKRKQQKEQQLIAEEEERQFIIKLKSSKPSKVMHTANHNLLPSNSAVTGKPWVCKKYLAVRSKVDSGVKKFPEKTIPRFPRSQSPLKNTSLPISSTHATWSNRRRCRTPYLHFINDVKLAKKTINPLGDGMHKIPIINKPQSKTMKQTTKIVKHIPRDDLILMSVKQYSLDYKEDEEEIIVPVSKSQYVNKSTSPRVISNPESTQPRDSEPEAPSPTFSEKGTGFQLRSKPSFKPREERVGPYAPTDPVEITKFVSHPVHIMITKPEPTSGPDINNLRHLIERALLDQIQIPSPSASFEKSESMTRIDNVSTPLPTEAGDGYSSHFSPEYSSREQNDRTLSPVENIKTPEVSQIISEHSFKPSRVSTPVSVSTSRKSSPIKSSKHQMISEAIQTICDNAVQTEENKEIQTMPMQSGTQTPKTPRKPPSETSAGTTTSEFNGSFSDTQVHSFSDGMWLYDRSEGEMAPYQIDTIARWKIGACPENPLWYNGTDDIVNVDRRSSESFGEFTKPTLPGLIPTLDPVLQLKTLPFKPPMENPNMNKDDDDFMYIGHRQQSPTNFRSLGVSRDSKSKFTTPRNYQMSSSNFKGSEGEVDYEDDNFNSEDDEKNQVNLEYRSSEEFRNDSPFLMNVRESKESGPKEPIIHLRDSQSDRMQVDLNKYLRGSKQSHSDMSDTGHLMSTAQILENAFRGGDSADFEGNSDFINDRFNDNHNINKQTVKIPTLGTVEQSNPSMSDDNLEIIEL